MCHNLRSAEIQPVITKNDPASLLQHKQLPPKGRALEKKLWNQVVSESSPERVKKSLSNKLIVLTDRLIRPLPVRTITVLMTLSLEVIHESTTPTGHLY